ncbi:MAG TPA: FGGY family carbohydrate kinase, partial [Aggregatilineales bacterium]|nr:FGGY family carbohydrate kinase [Aggregatilineales bacterium]
MSDTYLISIDCGTESARAAIFSADGKLVATHAEPYPLRHPKPGWAEQRPDEWWASIVGAIRG